MGLADTAKLVVDLSLSGNFTSQMSKATNAAKGFEKQIDRTSTRSYQAGQQIATGIKRATLIGVTAVGALIPVLISAAKHGQEAANVELIFAKAVQNSGKVSSTNVLALRAQQEALLNLAGVDDELIKTEQTRLIQMGLTGDQILRITPLILDFSKATGVDLLTATKLVGKATQGNIGALSRYGVQIDKAKAKVDPFGASVDALNKKFGGTTQVLSGQLNTKLSVLKEKLANIRDEAGIKLLPVFTRIADVVGQKLVPALQSFIDAVLPKVIEGLNKLADFLQAGGGTKLFSTFLNTAKTAAPIIEKSAQATFTIVKAAVDLFTSLPPEIQNLAVGAFAINKLTGGLVTNIAGGLADLIGNARGSSAGNPVWVRQVGSSPGGPGNSGGNNILGKILTVLSVVGDATAIGATQQEQAGMNSQIASDVSDAVKQQIAGGATLADLQRSLKSVTDGIDQIQSSPLTVLVAGDSLDKLKADALALAKAIADRQGGAGTTAAGISTLLDRGGRELGKATGKMRDDLNGVHDILAGFVAEFKGAVQDLKKARTAEQIKKAAAAATGLIEKGRGSVAGTSSVIAGLKQALRNTHDPKLAAILRADLAKVERKLPGRQFAAQQLAKADKLIRDGRVTNADLTKLKAIEQALKDHGLPSAAAKIGSRIDAAKRAEVAASHAAGQAAAAAIKDKDLSVTVNTTVNTSVSVRDQIRREHQISRIFATAS